MNIDIILKNPTVIDLIRIKKQINQYKANTFDEYVQQIIEIDQQLQTDFMNTLLSVQPHNILNDQLLLKTFNDLFKPPKYFPHINYGTVFKTLPSDILHMIMEYISTNEKLTIINRLNTSWAVLLNLPRNYTCWESKQCFHGYNGRMVSIASRNKHKASINYTKKIKYLKYDGGCRQCFSIQKWNKVQTLAISEDLDGYYAQVLANAPNVVSLNLSMIPVRFGSPNSTGRLITLIRQVLLLKKLKHLHISEVIINNATETEFMKVLCSKISNQLVSLHLNSICCQQFDELEGELFFRSKQIQLNKLQSFEMRSIRTRSKKSNKGIILPCYLMNEYSGNLTVLHIHDILDTVYHSWNIKQTIQKNYYNDSNINYTALDNIQTLCINRDEQLNMPHIIYLSHFLQSQMVPNLKHINSFITVHSLPYNLYNHLYPIIHLYNHKLQTVCFTLKLECWDTLPIQMYYIVNCIYNICLLLDKLQLSVKDDKCIKLKLKFQISGLSSNRIDKKCNDSFELLILSIIHLYNIVQSKFKKYMIGVRLDIKSLWKLCEITKYCDSKFSAMSQRKCTHDTKEYSSIITTDELRRHETNIGCVIRSNNSNYSYSETHDQHQCAYCQSTNWLP